MGKRVRIVYRSFVSLVLAGIFMAAVSGCNPPEKLSQTPENPPQPVQKPDEGSPAAAVKESPVQKPADSMPAVAVKEPPVQTPDGGSPAAVKETSAQNLVTACLPPL